ncbi:MAG: hypothetical protein IIV85_00045, partial [Clostridia bacterium]|nr:hypothetical protein [Clostridia bacterium]
YGLSDLIFHGHVPGKITLTRKQLRKAAAKPARRPELFCPEKPSIAVLRGNIKSDPFYRTHASKGPTKSLILRGPQKVR